MATVKDNQVEVTLEKPHTHAGVKYAAGEKLIVDRSDAKLLLNMKVIKELPASK